MTESIWRWLVPLGQRALQQINCESIKWFGELFGYVKKIAIVSTELVLGEDIPIECAVIS